MPGSRLLEITRSASLPKEDFNRARHVSRTYATRTSTLCVTNPTSLRTVIPASLASVLMVSHCAQHIKSVDTWKSLNLHTLIKLKHSRRDIARPNPILSKSTSPNHPIIRT